jgi:hypothetical protein
MEGISVRFEIEDFGSVQEIHVFDLNFLGNHDERSFYNSLYCSGVHCRLGPKYIELTIPKSLVYSDRAIQTLRRYGFEDEILRKIDGLTEALAEETKVKDRRKELGLD